MLFNASSANSLNLWIGNVIDTKGFSLKKLLTEGKYRGLP
jgi:hypothetical protein